MRRERKRARGQRGRIIRPQNPEAFNIIRYRVSGIGCRECGKGGPRGKWEGRVKTRPREREDKGVKVRRENAGGWSDSNTLRVARK